MQCFLTILKLIHFQLDSFFFTKSNFFLEVNTFFFRYSVPFYTLMTRNLLWYGNGHSNQR